MPCCERCLIAQCRIKRKSIWGLIAGFLCRYHFHKFVGWAFIEMSLIDIKIVKKFYLSFHQMSSHCCLHFQSMNQSLRKKLHEIFFSNQIMKIKCQFILLSCHLYLPPVVTPFTEDPDDHVPDVPDGPEPMFMMNFHKLIVFLSNIRSHDILNTI